MPLSNRRLLRSVENEQNGNTLHHAKAGTRRTITLESLNKPRKETPARRSSRNSGYRPQKEPVDATAVTDNAADHSGADSSVFVTPLPPSALRSSQSRASSRYRHSTSPSIEPPSVDFASIVSSTELTIGPRESTPAGSIRSDRSRSSSRRNSSDAEPLRSSSRLSTVSSSSCSRGTRPTLTIDPVFSDEDDDSLLPHAYSTFFESSTLGNNMRTCNLLKPRFVEPTNFFPGDDIDEDVPWIGKISRTYSRKRRRDGGPTRIIPQDSDDSSHSEGEDLFEVEIRMAKANALKKNNSKSKQKRLPPLPPGFSKWANRTNAEFSEVDKHRLSVEDNPNNS